MDVYRIKINKLSNGEVEYIPQVSFSTDSIIGTSWNNIINENYLSNTSELSLNTENEALDMIKKYDEYSNKKNNQSVLFTTYKTIKL